MMDCGKAIYPNDGLSEYAREIRVLNSLREFSIETLKSACEKQQIQFYDSLVTGFKEKLDVRISSEPITLLWEKAKIEKKMERFFVQ